MENGELSQIIRLVSTLWKVYGLFMWLKLWILEAQIEPDDPGVLGR